MVTWGAAWRFKRYGHMAGYGPVTDGVPETIGHGDSDRLMPPPPRGLDKTVREGRAR